MLASLLRRASSASLTRSCGNHIQEAFSRRVSSSFFDFGGQSAGPQGAPSCGSLGAVFDFGTRFFSSHQPSLIAELGSLKIGDISVRRSILQGSRWLGESGGVSRKAFGSRPGDAYNTASKVKGSVIASLPQEKVFCSSTQPLPEDGNKNAQQVEKANEGLVQIRQRLVPVRAYFIGHKIDLVGVANDQVLRLLRRFNGRDHIIIEIPEKGFEGYPLHLAVFKYGSVVLFNAPAPQEVHHEFLSICRKYTSEPSTRPNQEVQTLIISPQMKHWFRQEGDRILIKVLDTDNMRVIASVLGQSVALDQYSRQVDQALEEFNMINREMERTGSFTVSRKELFRLVARNNIMITEAIVVLGLLDRSDTAWTNDRYYGVWSAMQSEYELANRFEAMDKKLSLIQDSAKYFLGILQDKKSVFLEWFIIVLIMGEIVVSVYDLATRT